MDDFEQLLREEIARSCERGLETIAIIDSAIDSSENLKSMELEALTSMYRCLAETTALFRFYNKHFHNAGLRAQEKSIKSKMLEVEKNVNRLYKMILGS